MKKSDLVIIFIGLVILTITGSMLFFNVNLLNIGNTISATQVGVIEFVDNDVRKKPENDLIWQDASKDQGIELNDTIFTGASSTAKIRLKDETLIELDENSLIVITDTRLELKGGSLISDLGENSKIDLFIDGEKRILTNSSLDTKTKVKVSISKEGTFDVNVIEGQVKVESNNVEKVVEKNSGISQTKAGKMEEYVYKGINLSTPENNLDIIETQIGDVLFSWNTEEQNVEFLFELSSTKSFSDISYSLKTPKSSLRLLRIGKDKNYFWRVSYRGKNKNIRSEVRSLRVKEAPAARLLSPAEGQNIEFINNQIQFTWDDVTSADSYIFELSKSEDFITDVIRKELNERVVSLTLKDPDRYYWRVSGKYLKTGKQVTSRSQAFTLLARARNFAHYFPLNNQTFESNNKQVLVNFKFSERSSYEGDLGRFQVIATNIETEEIIKSDIVSTNQVKVSLPIGKYQWAVRDIMKQESLSRDYVLGKFYVNFVDKIEPPSNLSTSLLNGEAFAEPLVRFSWNPYNPELNIKFELRDEGGNPILSKSLERGVNNVDFKYTKKTPGEWRVSHIDNQGKTLASSKWLRFNVGNFYNRKSINLLAPTDGEKIKDSVEFVNFEWKNNYPSRNYKINLYKSSSKIPVFSKKVLGTKYKIHPPKVGQYFWQVVDLDSNNPFIKETPLQSFNIIVDKQREKVRAKNKKIDVEEIFPLAF
jgi:hypothetical protein